MTLKTTKFLNFNLVNFYRRKSLIWPLTTSCGGLEIKTAAPRALNFIIDYKYIFNIDGEKKESSFN